MDFKAFCYFSQTIRTHFIIIMALIVSLDCLADCEVTDSHKYLLCCDEELHEANCFKTTDTCNLSLSSSIANGFIYNCAQNFANESASTGIPEACTSSLQTSASPVSKQIETFETIENILKENKEPIPDNKYLSRAKLFHSDFCQKKGALAANDEEDEFDNNPLENVALDWKRKYQKMLTEQKEVIATNRSRNIADAYGIASLIVKDKEDRHPSNIKPKYRLICNSNGTIVGMSVLYQPINKSEAAELKYALISPEFLNTPFIGTALILDAFRETENHDLILQSVGASRGFYKHLKFKELNDTYMMMTREQANNEFTIETIRWRP